MPLTGGCGCGAVRYRIGVEAMFTHACHCMDCQRTTGSAFVIHSVYARDDLQIVGETQAAILPSGSGAGCELHFCAKCGTYIWCRYLYHKVDVIALRVGTLDDTSKVKPRAHIFLRSKQAWLELPADVPTFEGALDRDAVWPVESVERYNATRPGG
ncbi:MAG: GFA family protein [Rhodospirillaceae bacterium]|nr:GFA family protein [Rhodospirillaceae bacterium]MBT5079732.1 GFA family protein [Rhodospirillaceae bacterium]MBT5526305.1 GFA family protein [Rhodospirillaceae bacterium]MBT5881545.1 GFA family protein [Rhodospirillaceae bacterium]MBT6587505.1 GFA family protein [Rhodospirillaceae bacterium]